MGNSSSSEQQPHPPSQAYAQPQVYAQAPAHTHGSYLMMGAQGAAPGPSPYGQFTAPQQVPRVPIPQEFQTTATIRNQVNLRKGSIKVKALPDDPQRLAISFAFDATADCRVSVFVNAQDRGNRVLSGEPPVAVAFFGKGIDSRFPSPDSEGGPLQGTLPTASTSGWAGMPAGRYGVAVRLEALTDEGRARGMDLSSVEVGGALPPWVQAQTTFAHLQALDDGSWAAHNVTQKLWIRGQVFELHEIYGMEPGRPAEGDHAAGAQVVEGSECVICMSAPRDTTALPCRHMCMCHACANELKTQTNKCPICRNVINSLLHIKVTQAAAAASPAAPAAVDGAS